MARLLCNLAFFRMAYSSNNLQMQTMRTKVESISTFNMISFRVSEDKKDCVFYADISYKITYYYPCKRYKSSISLNSFSSC